jgi:GT2 family glycosyltransferase
VAWRGRISALVLTYNRKDILSRCLYAIVNQVEPADEIIVFDNGSTDGTFEFLRDSGLLPHVVVYRQEQNTGPAAGAEALFRVAMERGSDWLWFLDDDTIPDATALKELKAAYAEDFSGPEEVGFLRSFVVFPDGSPYDLPPVDVRHEKGKSPAWADRLNAGLVRMRWCQLNSMLLPRSTILKVGNVRPVFYFAGEDHDFTLRITEVLPGYLVGKSRATHLQSVTGHFSVLTEADPARIRLGRYYYRNNVYFRWRYHSIPRMFGYIGKCLFDSIRALRTRPHPLLRFVVILHGVLSGFIFIARYRETSTTTICPRDAFVLASEPQVRPGQISSKSDRTSGSSVGASAAL